MSGSSAEALAWYSRAIRTVESVSSKGLESAGSVLRDAYHGRAEVWARLRRPAEALLDLAPAFALAEGHERLRTLWAGVLMLLPDPTQASKVAFIAQPPGECYLAPAFFAACASIFFRARAAA